MATKKAAAAASKKKPAAKPAKSTKKAAAPKGEKPAKSEPKAKPVARGPLARMKALYGTKDKLVDTLAGSLATDGQDEGALKDRLLKASNAQLLKLAGVVEQVKKTYGSRDKLVDALAKALNRAKDQPYVAKLASFSLPRLFDMARAAERRVKASK
ncbi:MAG: hypothetical protein K8M05_18915 [Deltaproteobacteria bacterium]|nr:hypothetical protein [Kofleriaceae bacterium]